MYLKKVDVSKEKQKADRKSEVVLFGQNISKDSDGRISLTDLWKAVGSIESKAPKFWLDQDPTIMFIDTLITVQKVTRDYLLKVKRGKSGGTMADKQIALAYAKYLSPELHIAVNQIFFERIEEEKNPQLAIDRAVNTWKKKGKTDEWIGVRLNSKAARITFTNTLMQHGVTGNGYSQCTDAIYKPLWGGGANLVRKKKNLPAKSNIRENLSMTELATVILAESLAADNIEKNNIRGNAGCKNECLRTSSIIAQAVRTSLGK